MQKMIPVSNQGLMGIESLVHNCGSDIPHGSHVSPISDQTISGSKGRFWSPVHAQNVLRRMDGYFKRDVFCDITLIAAGRHFKAHKIVLSSTSDYFDAMFTNPVIEAKTNEVELKGIDCDALETVLNYCYTGSVEINEENVEVVLSTAHQLLLTEVIDICCKFLTKQLHPANSLGIQLFSDRLGCTTLNRVASNYTAQHFLEVVQHQEFLQLPSSEIANLFESNDLNVPTEETIYKALLLWLNYDLCNRKQHMSKLLSLVKLPHLSPQFLVDHVEGNELFKDNWECQELIKEAMKYHLLPERRSSLQTSRMTPRKSTVGNLYIIGGAHANKSGPNIIEKYDLRTNSWSFVAAMNGKRSQIGVAVLDRKIYVAGGRDGLKTLSTFESYDPKVNLWTVLPQMSTHRHGLGVAVLEGPLYAVGGHDGWSYLNTVERWDPLTRQWSYVQSMYTARSTVGVAVLNGRLYVVGGRDGPACLRSVECYDPHTNRWTMVAPMNICRGGAAVAVLEGFIYAVGGHDAPPSNANATRFDSVERYDPVTDEWTMVASLPVGCDSAGLCVLGNKLFCIGGYDGQVPLDVVQVYDPITNEWTKAANLSSGRAGPCAAVISNS